MTQKLYVVFDNELCHFPWWRPSRSCWDPSSDVHILTALFPVFVSSKKWACYPLRALWSSSYPWIFEGMSLGALYYPRPVALEEMNLPWLLPSQCQQEQLLLICCSDSAEMHQKSDLVRALVLMTTLTSFDQISSKSSWLLSPLSCCFL